MEVFVVVVVVFDGNDFLVIGIVFYSTNLLRSLITRRIGERFLCPTIFSTIAAVTANGIRPRVHAINAMPLFAGFSSPPLCVVVPPSWCAASPLSRPCMVASPLISVRDGDFLDELSIFVFLIANVSPVC